MIFLKGTLKSLKNSCSNMVRLRKSSIEPLHRRMLAWYRDNHRIFFWRSTRDPYTIIVSEIMLQQTQTSRVQEKLPYFLKHFPTMAALARASTGDVVRAWRGLGYNNRAVRLRQLARIVVNRRGGT